MSAARGLAGQVPNSTVDSVLGPLGQLSVRQLSRAVAGFSSTAAEEVGHRSSCWQTPVSAVTQAAPVSRAVPA
jgi:hypothetical protein